MNEMKKTNIIDRIRNAWSALRGKTAKAMTIEIGMRRCDKCEYRGRATDPNGWAPPNRYWHEIEYLENVVLVVLYEATEDGPKELARAHGHIIHEGAEGIAQAASYAMRLIWFKIHGEQ